MAALGVSIGLIIFVSVGINIDEILDLAFAKMAE